MVDGHTTGPVRGGRVVVVARRCCMRAVGAGLVRDALRWGVESRNALEQPLGPAGDYPIMPPEVRCAGAAG
jgi:hypothetical protein